jgi:hypothetical protein
MLLILRQNIGVADALKKKFLATVQFSIYEGFVSARTLFEAYIISVTYNEKGEAPSLQVSRTTKSTSVMGEETVVLADAKKQLRRLIDNIIIDAQSLEELAPEYPGCYDEAHIKVDR